MHSPISCELFIESGSVLREESDASTSMVAKENRSTCGYDKDVDESLHSEFIHLYSPKWPWT